MTQLGITGMSSEEAADEIRKQLKKNYPFFYEIYWGNSDDYKEYYNSIDPLKLDFCPNEDNEILVYDSWGLPYGDNANGLEVYVTLHVK